MNKVKFLVLSVAAIAVWAGCSKNNDAIPDRPKAPEARVILKLTGEGDAAGTLKTKTSAGIPDGIGEQNGMIQDLTVFIFNGGGDLLNRFFIPKENLADLSSLTTTTDAAKVAVVANAGNLLESLFKPVSTEATLRGAIADLLKTPDNPAGELTQKDTNLYMAGMNTLSDFTKSSLDDNAPMTATANVELLYVGARIRLTKISYNGGPTITDNVYAPFTTFNAPNNAANFTIERIYLMNVQRMTRFFPKSQSEGYIAQPEKKFTGGVAWGDPWDKDVLGVAVAAPADYKVNNEFCIEAAKVQAPDESNNINNIGHWYVFANPDVSDIEKSPTAIVVKALWRKSTTEIVDRYFTVYFGGGDDSHMIAAGQDYEVTMALNGNFHTEADGGSGGGGTTTPGKPTTSSSVTITITKHGWDPAITINKVFP